MLYWCTRLSPLMKADGKICVAAHQRCFSTCLHCTEEDSGQAVISYKATMLPLKLVESITVSPKVSQPA